MHITIYGVHVVYIVALSLNIAAVWIFFSIQGLITRSAWTVSTPRWSHVFSLGPQSQVWSKPHQHFEVLLFSLTCNENIINVTVYTYMGDTSQDSFHGPLKYGRCGMDAERKVVVAIQAFVRIDHCVLLGIFIECQLLIRMR